MCSLQNGPGSPKPYDYLLKFLLVGDSDVGKEELLSGMEDGATESPYPSTDGKDCKRLREFSLAYAHCLNKCSIFETII